MEKNLMGLISKDNRRRAVEKNLSLSESASPRRVGSTPLKPAEC